MFGNMVENVVLIDIWGTLIEAGLEHNVSSFGCIGKHSNCTHFDNTYKR